MSITLTGSQKVTLTTESAVELAGVVAFKDVKNGVVTEHSAVIDIAAATDTDIVPAAPAHATRIVTALYLTNQQPAGSNAITITAAGSSVFIGTMGIGDSLAFDGTTFSHTVGGGDGAAAGGNGGSSSYIELEQDNSQDLPFGVSTNLVFDSGIVGHGGSGITLNVAQDTVTLAEAGFYVVTGNFHLTYGVDVTGYAIDFGGWSDQVSQSGGAIGTAYALVSAADHYAAGATITFAIKPNRGAGNTPGNSNFAFAAIAKIG